MRRLLPILFVPSLLVLAPSQASAQYNRLCDPAYENCRTPIIELIRNESVGIDVGFWFMEDTRYSAELIKKHQAGVPVRVIFDSRAFEEFGYAGAKVAVQQMKDAGIPIRQKTGGAGIFHFKTMIFAGQNVVEFSGANYSAEAFVPITPYSNYIDEVIMFSNEASIVNSFKTRFDDVWTDVTTGSQKFVNYANISGPLTRHYPTYPIDPELSFSPWNSFASRSISRYRAETTANGGRIDAIMYRITDQRHTNEMIAAVNRGVQVRLISEPAQYRDQTRLWHSWNIDRLYMGGVKIRHRKHAGLSHEKLTVLHGQQMVILGSSNWTSASDQSQHEHNLFTTKPWVYTWSVDHFNRKWNNSGPAVETEPFTPLPPDTPVMKQPANAAQNQPTSVSLKWYAGLWAHKYDVYLGTSPTEMTKIVNDRELGPSEFSTDYITWNVTGLAAGTTYYWKVVSRTMANLEKAGPVWSFRTEGGTPVEPGQGDVLLWARTAPVVKGWQVVSDSTAAGGARLSNPNLNAPKLANALASPTQYFELTFDATAGIPYRLWIRGRAERNDYSNDSVFVQFSGSVTSSGTPTYRIGTTSATVVSIEECSGCGLAAWGWADNGYGVDGPLIYFANSGTQTIRVQVREDGVSIDQIMLSPGAHLSTMPGQPKNDATIYPQAGGSGNLPSDPDPNPTDPPQTALPSGWSSGDVGAVGRPGISTQTSGTFTLQGAGADVWNNADEFHFAYRSLTGNGSIVARVATVQNVHQWTKAGVMMRDGLTAGAAHAFMLVSPGKGLAFQRRVSAGGISTHTDGGAGTAPAWVKLTRSGNTFSAYRSANGTTWTLVGTETIAMGSTISVGLAVSSHDDSRLASATFDSVTVE